MAQSPLPGRYLSRESYHPLADMHTVYAGRNNAWYWLNWSAPKATHRVFMEEIYPRLHHQRSIEYALKLAGLFDVRFITYDLLQGSAVRTRSLRPLFQGQTYAVFENLHCRDEVQLYALPEDADPPTTLADLLARETGAKEYQVAPNISSDRITVEAVCQDKALLVVAQSYYPGWSVMVDDGPAALRTIEGDLPAVILAPGNHRVIFSYNRPWHFHASILMTLMGIGVAASLLRRRKPSSTPSQ